MDETELNKRKQEIDNFNKIFNNLEGQLDDLLNTLNWTKDKLPKPRTEQIESLNTSSVESESNTSSTSRTSSNKTEALNKSFDLHALSEISSTLNKKKSDTKPNIDIAKLKRDLKRRRMKHRTTKSAPLTYTEELRELINLQMDLLNEDET